MSDETVKSSPGWGAAFQLAGFFGGERYAHPAKSSRPALPAKSPAPPPRKPTATSVWITCAHYTCMVKLRNKKALSEHNPPARQIFSAVQKNPSCVSPILFFCGRKICPGPTQPRPGISVHPRAEGHFQQTRSGQRWGLEQRVWA